MAATLRRIGLITILIGGLGMANQAAAQSSDDWLEKLDLEARQLVRAESPEQRVDVAHRLASTHDVVVRRDREVRTGLLILLDDPLTAPLLESRGFRLETLAGRVAVGTVDAADLEILARIDGVRSIQVSRYVELLNDLGNEAINTIPVHNGTGLPQPYRGEGVVVGIFDTGIDFTHPDFSDADGNTRIEYLLEYLPDDDNQPPEAYAEWTAEDIDNNPELVTQRDIHGHGTHVAGTAAGGGMASPHLHGAAPASRLIVVKGSRTGTDPNRPHFFTERDIINGTAYIFERAADLGMPAVANYSIGSPGPPLDGTQNINTAMSELAGEGRIIVIAGGNDGTRRLHWGTDIAEGDAAAMVPRYGTFTIACCGQSMVIDTWYDTSALASVTVTARDTLTLQSRASLTVPIGEATPDFRLLTSPEADIVGWVDVDATITSHPDNQDGVIRVFIANMGSHVELNDHVWSITLNAASGGRADAWLLTRAMGQFEADHTGVPHFVPGDNLMTLNRLAAAHEVITAGSFTTRTEWLNAQGELIVAHFQGEPVPVGPRSHFSSLGPTRDGRVRPDVLTPGAWILSALSSDSNFGGSFYGEPYYSVANGTSMAAPFLTGVVALMLQVNPTLTPAQVREIIRSTAATDEHTGTVPNPEYGYGKADALAAVQETLTTVGSEPQQGPLAMLALGTPFPNPSRSGASLAIHLPSDGHVTLSIYDLLGREVRRVLDGHQAVGPHRLHLDRGMLAAGVYLVVLSSESARATARMVVID